jgi:hypothetical protein
MMNFVISGAEPSGSGLVVLVNDGIQFETVNLLHAIEILVHVSKYHLKPVKNGGFQEAPKRLTSSFYGYCYN